MKKALSIFLVLILFLGFSAVVNPTAAAAEAVEAVTAYITVSLQGENGAPVFAEARDGSQVAVKAVTVSDQDGDGMLTVYDMLYCAHVQLAPGGANDFSTVTGSQNTVSAKTLWNRDAADFTIVGGKQVNFHKEFKKNLKCSYPIVSGYHLYLIQNQKTDFFSGISIRNGADGSYSGAQAAQITAMKDQKFTLGLYLVDAAQSSPAKNLAKASGRSIYYKKGNDSAQLAGTTDKTGKIECTLTEAGDYFFYSAPGDNAISPAVCVVHVLEQCPTIESVSLALTKGGENILSGFSSATREYTITIPDGTTTLYGQVRANAEQAGIINWYDQKSTDGATWKSGPVSGITDGETVTSVSVDGANKVKLYLNDRHLYASGDQPLSEEYIFTVKRQVQLTGLETSGQTTSSADFRTGSLDVYVPCDATEATLTPCAADGDTITVDEAQVASGSAASISLTGQETTAVINVHREGDAYVDGRYTITFHRADASAAPVFRENLTPELLEYITGDDSSLLKALHVLADANGDVSYQWYYNTTDSTEGGTAIPDATGRSYLPPVDQATNRYYYCVASNGEYSTASAAVHVIVYDASAFSIDWDMTVPDVPEDKAELFEGSEQGFYYQKGDTNVTPLRVKLTLPDGFAEKFQDGTASVSYYWGIGGYSAYTHTPEYTPDTSIAYGLRNWYSYAQIRFADRGYFITRGTAYSNKVSVYVDRAGDHVPADIAWDGEGTESSPYELSSQSDLETLREFVSQGYDFAETYLLMTKDIELDEKWISIGGGDDSSKGVDWKPFSGILDGGNHVLTYAEGTDQPLFKYVREATVKNLTIYAPYLKNYGLVSNYSVDYGDDGDYSAGFGGSYVAGTPDTIDIINVTIQSGSIIEQAGFIGGFASGANIVNIRDCVVEENVKIGWSKENNASAGNGNIGSFGGWISGTIINCTSAADLYGINYVGGMVGQKGQSMGPYDIINCSFTGTVTATGKYVGGIAGGGYFASSAPNTPGAIIQNCYVSGTITGVSCVGGIFGGEPSQLQAWDQSIIQDNAFYGTVSATGENASCGGIIGSMASLNRNNIIENNYYVEGCGASKGIGNVLYLDTSCENPAHPEGCTVFDSSTALPGRSGISLPDKNRTDDPLGADADKLAAMKTAGEFKDGTVVSLLNASNSSWKNWTQGTNGPVQSREPIFIKLEVSGSYKSTYRPGEELDLTGIEFTAYRSDDVVEHPALNEVEQLSTFDPQFIGEQAITFQYGAAKATIYVSVIKEYTDDERENFGTATVLFSLSDDDQFVTSDSAALSNVPIKVTYFDLANYGLERYYCYDDTGSPIEQPTMLHLFITALEQYKLGLDAESCGLGKLTESSEYNSLLSITGFAGSMYMTSFWNHDENLTYFYNGDYPLESEGRGATADQILLKDGDFVDVAMYSDWSFYSEEKSGFHFFSADGKTPQKTFTVEKSADLNLTYLLAHTDMDGSSAVYTSVPGTTVYYAKSMYSSDAYTAVTNETDGTVTLNFTDTGIWYVWTNGARGGEKNSVISAPGCATVTVTPSQAEIDQAKADKVKSLIAAIGDVTLESEDAIKAAREAYDALTDEQKALVSNYDVLVAAETRYAQLVDEAAAEHVIDLINGIGKVNKNSGTAIKAARDAYDALTPAQKKLVSNYQTLLDAEKRYDEITAPITPVGPSKPSKPAVPDTGKNLPFTDVAKSDWYYDGVKYAYDNGLMNGTGANAFSPNADTTRGMIVTILARLEGINTSGGAVWYEAGREWAMKNGISDGTNMEGKITREQLAAMLYRYAKLKGYDVSASASLSGYTDASSVSGWAKEAMQWAVGSGLIQGSGNALTPQANASRAQIATILMRFAEKIAK